MKKTLTILLLLLGNIALHAQIGADGYNPENPPAPGEDGDTVKYVILHLYSDPPNGGTFSWGLGSQGEYYYYVEPGKQYAATSYPNKEFDFSHWSIDGTVVGRELQYTFTAPDHDFSLVCHYVYNPESPANPGKHYWNGDTGDLIITDFKAGRLYDALNEAMSQIDYWNGWKLLKSVTVAGTCGSIEAYDYPDSDWEAFSYFSNLTRIDMSRTAGLDAVPSYCFNGNTKIQEVHMPATTQSIGSYAFQGCTALEKLVCLATTPPALGKDVFKNAGAFTVSVPAESMGLYAAAEGWKDLTLLPIIENVSHLTVSLPLTVNLSTYRDMFVELINLQTGQVKRMVITDRYDYTFNNLLSNTAYNAYLRTQNGGIVARVDSIAIIDHDMKVEFGQLKKPVDLSITLTTPEGSNVTEQAAVTWTDRRNNFLARSSTLNGRVEGDSVCYIVKLNEALGTVYRQPAADTLRVGSNNADIALRLSLLQQTVVNGTVTAESTGRPVRGASVSAVQQLNGIYPYTVTTQTDANGHYTLTLYEAPTELTAFSSEYLKQTAVAETHPAMASIDFSLKDITGTIIDLDLHYIPSLADGEEDQSEDYYFDNQSDVAYTVYDMTSQRDITTMSVQFPQLVLTNDELVPGTQLRITGTSKSGSFMPVENTCRVDSTGHAVITLGIKQLGVLNASFEMTDNKQVVGIVYDGEGRIVGQAPYSEARLTIDALPDGDYTLVTMGYSSRFSALGTLTALKESGMRDGRNCVMNTFRAESGRVIEVYNHTIPFFDDTEMLFTEPTSYFRCNKDAVTVGNYVTLRTKVTFKPIYADQVSNVKLAFDLPEYCEFVEGSVIVGSSIASYEQTDNRVVILMDDPTAEVRFCVIPTKSGIMQPTANVRFTIDGTRKVQPVGTAVFTAEDMAIDVRETTAVAHIPVSGTAPSNSRIEVYDGQTLIGQTEALLSGSWTVWADLIRAYNMSEHYVYAKIITPEGITMQTATVTVTIDNADVLPIVDMSFWNNLHGLEEHVIWNFQTNTVNKSSYGWPLDHSSLPITFQIDFTAGNQLANDTTLIHNVMLGVELDNGTLLELPATFNKLKKCWLVERDIDTEALPMNVWVEWYATGSEAIDRAQLDDMLGDIEGAYLESQQVFIDAESDFNIDNIVEDDHDAYEELDALLDIEDPDEATLARRDSLMRIVLGDDVIEKARAKYSIDFTEVDAILERNRNNPDPEEVISLSAKLVSLIDNAPSPEEGLGDDFDDLLAELTAGNDSVKAMALRMKESVMGALSMFYAGYDDPYQLPEDDMEFTVPGDSLERRYVQKTLTSINRDQLLEDGYIEYEVNDGSFIYVRYQGLGFSIIDTKTMMMRSMEQAPTDVAQARYNGKFIHNGGVGTAKAFISKDCIHLFTAGVDKLVKTAETMKNAGFDWDGFKKALSVANEDLKELKTALNCMYNEGMESLSDEINNRFGEKVQGEAEGEISKRQQMIEKKAQKIAEHEAELMKIEKSKPRLLETQALLEECLKTSQSPEMTQRLNSELKQVQRQIHWAENAATREKMWVRQGNNFIQLCKQEIKEVETLLKDAKRNHKLITAIFEKIPKSTAAILAAGRSAIMGSGILGKVFGTVIGAFFQIAPLVILISDNVKDANEWGQLVEEVKGYDPCEGDEANWQQLYSDVKWDCTWHTSIDYGQIAADAGSLIIDVFDLPLTPHWLVSLIIDVASITTAFVHPSCSDNDKRKIRNRIAGLDCDPEPDKIIPDDEEMPSNTAFGVSRAWGYSGSRALNRSVKRQKALSTKPARDPSGYVYEAVSSNRLEGVTATCYYKEEVEDMYGDLYERVVVWDAENYAQENPLFTDSEGKYAWDVPKGLWQVKFEKEGYETTYSDWLPVPPPQLDVNVGMTQLRQPQVSRVRACTNGVEVQFDKFMRPQTLTADNITLTKGGQPMAATITIKDADSGYQKPDEQYASRLMIVPQQPLAKGDKVTLTVRRNVESYAGLQMEADYQQQFDVTLRVEQLTTDSTATLAQGDELTLTVQALPAEAARGKRLSVTAQPAEVLATSADALTFDQSGKATVKVSAKSIGSGAVTFTMPEEELKASTEVTVRDRSNMQVEAPRSSRLSGTTLYYGTEIELSSRTTGATILYTLDGSCPCDADNGKVLTYTAPIVMTGDEMVIRAMAVANGMTDSDVVEFSYKGTARPSAIEAPTMSDGSPDKADAPKLFFRLNGQRVTRPERGITIERHGARVRKVVVE